MKVVFPLEHLRGFEFMALIQWRRGYAVVSSDIIYVFSSICSKIDLKEGGIGIVELLCRTNYMGLVGGGANPAWAPNRFNLWEDRAGQVISHLEFKTKEIKNIKMTRDRLIIILMNKIIVYTLTAQPQKLASVDTCDNEFGNLEVVEFLIVSLIFA